MKILISEGVELTIAMWKLLFQLTLLFNNFSKLTFSLLTFSIDLAFSITFSITF